MERKIDKLCVYEGEEYLACEEVISFLFEYLSDEIAPERAREFERHLAICPSCLAYLESYRATIRLAREQTRSESPVAASSTAAPLVASPAELAPELVRAILASRPRKEPAP